MPIVPKRKLALVTPPGRHMVGDGLLVHNMFNYGAGAKSRSPFLLMDYGAELEFPPNNGKPKGVGLHPHKGFETVTIAYQGEIEHQDTHGGGGIIGPGDCQWMTAGRGIQHKEYFSKSFSLKGGKVEMMQLWVNLPAKHKLTEPRYQAIHNKEVAVVDLPNGAGIARLYAGELDGKRGPAQTFTPMSVWDLRLNPGTKTELNQPEGWTTLLIVQNGNARVNGVDVNTHQLLHLSNEGTGVTIEAKEDEHVKILFLAGEPFDEPVVGHGPFVMNTREEIETAFSEFYAGKF